MAFSKSLQLYPCIFMLLFTKGCASNGLNSDKINLSEPSLLTNEFMVINSTISSKTKTTLFNATLPGSSSSNLASAKLEIREFSQRSLFSFKDQSHPRHSEGNPPKDGRNNTDTIGLVLSQDDLDNIAQYGDDIVSMPDLPCETDHDCQKWDSGAPMSCDEEGQCQCPDSLCWHYQVQSQGGIYVNIFSCQECGSLGSACHKNADCEEPGACWTDDFCHCDSGTNYYDICLIQVIGFEDNSLTIVLGITFLTLVFIFCCIAYKPNIHSFCWQTCHRITTTDEESQRNAAARRRTRRLRRHKSPAFTHTEIFRDSEDQQSV